MTGITASTTEKDSFLTALRSHTAYWHQQLEQTDISKALLQDDLTPEVYKLYLQKMYGFVQAFEAQILPLITNVIPDWQERKKAAALKADLIKLGASDAAIAALPVFSITENYTEAAALGAMYVMEGSSLGGAVIYKHVAKKLGLDGETGAGYFKGYGPETGSRWKAFIGSFTDYAVIHQQQQTIMDSATHTFKQIYHWFQD